MYITKDFVLVHMNKTGCTTVKDFMVKYFGASVHKFKHAPLRMLDDIHRDKTKIGVIRNPYDWYASYYSYLVSAGRLTTQSFDEFVKTYTKHPRALLDFMGKKVRRKFENLYPPKTNLPIGSWSYHFINYFMYNAIEMFKTWGSETLDCECDENGHLYDVDILLRTEHLMNDMVSVFGNSYKDRIESFPRKNVSTNKPAITDELKEVIKERESILMEYLGYE